ncbi:hypothetical protein IRJ41_017333 [Triplophysa rosa]|uniref:Coiled-coil domain-containing protein 106 n=1 Tax=Triplophysa rosa TaxID=992332 RepID=A0A9W7TME4_TRIRA|nr:hypothetical protein IRJ41_017333 [Triplophysa rosa]
MDESRKATRNEDNNKKNHKYSSDLYVLPARKRVQSENPTRSSVVAPTAQIAFDQAKKTIEIQKQNFLTDDRNYLRSRLEDALRCEAVNSSGPNAASSTVATSQSTDESSESSNSSDSSDSEPRTPEDSIKCYHKVVQLVKGGLSKAEAYHKIKVDRNTIVMQAPIAELATANQEEFKALRATFKNGESIQKFSNMCYARCLAQPNVDVIRRLKDRHALLDISKK